MTPCLHDRKGLARVAPCPQCGERKPVSASEVKLARTCWRKWAFRYASEFPKPEETQAQKDGTQLHALLETRHNDGTRPDPTAPMGELACAVVDSGLLPPPQSGRAEEPQPLVLHGIPFVTIRDWYGWYDDIPNPIDDLQGLAAVIDYKTSSNPKRYGLWSREEWVDDPAVLLYGELDCDGDEIYYRWIYAPTKGRGKVVASDQILSRREIRGGLERVVLPVAERAYRLREHEIDPNSLDANLSSCMLYNRPCEYTDVCDVNRSSLYLAGLAPEKDDEMTTSLPNLFAALPPVNGAPAAAPPPVTPAPAPAAAPGFTFSFPSAPVVPTPQPNMLLTAPVQEIPPPALVLSTGSVALDTVLAERAQEKLPPAGSTDAFVVTVRWERGKEAEYEFRFSAKSTGCGATLDDAIKAALTALPR